MDSNAKKVVALNGDADYWKQSATAAGAEQGKYEQLHAGSGPGSITSIGVLMR